MDGIVILILSVALAAVAALLGRSILRMRRAMRRFEVLNRIAEVSDRGGSLRETLDAICEIIVPELADFCMIDVIEERPGRAGRRAGRRPAAAEAVERASPGASPRCRSDGRAAPDGR